MNKKRKNIEEVNKLYFYHLTSIININFEVLFSYIFLYKQPITINMIVTVLKFNLQKNSK